MIDAVPYAGLSREVDHDLRVVPAEHVLQKSAVREISLKELESGPCNIPKSEFFQRDVVVVIKVVDPDDAESAFVGQSFRESGAYKSRYAGDQYRCVQFR